MPNKIELKENERKIANDFMNFLNNDMKDLLLINVAAYIMQQNKMQSRNITANWASESRVNQKAMAEKIYEEMSARDKARSTIDQERYLEIFDWCVESARLNWNSILGLENVIIIN